jgi:mannosyltransferase
MPAGTPASTVLGLLALMAVSLVVRSGSLDTGFWIDEGLSVGIADRPLTAIPDALRQDGSPPLYYVLLHAWMALAGDSETATHALSVLFALLSVPAAWWALRAGFGSRAGWVAAVLLALNPFLTSYAQETRMYALVVLLGTLTCGAFLRAVVWDRPRWRVPAGVLLAALLYTHNWALFFAGASGLAWLVLLAVADGARRPTLVRAGVVTFAVTALLYLPWLPTTLFQAAHTGAPWALAPPASELPQVFPRLLGSMAQFVLLLAAGIGLARLARPGERRAAAALAVMLVATLLLAWLSSQLAPAWALRYLAVAVAPLLLLAAVGLSRAGGTGLAGLAIVAAVWAFDGPPPEKSNVRDLAEAVEPALRPGDLVVSTQPEQIPVLDYYLPDGLRYATLWGPVSDLGVTDWRDGAERLEATAAERDLEPLIRELEPGRRLVLVEPIVYDAERWSAPWTELVRVRSVEWADHVREDEWLAITAIVPATSYPARPNPLRATVAIRLPVD